jgi:hypothetical protein
LKVPTRAHVTIGCCWSGGGGGSGVGSGVVGVGSVVAGDVPVVTEVADGDVAKEPLSREGVVNGVVLVLMSCRPAGDDVKEGAPDDVEMARALGEADAPSTLGDVTTSWFGASCACGESATSPPG